MPNANRKLAKEIGKRLEELRIEASQEEGFEVGTTAFAEAYLGVRRQGYAGWIDGTNTPGVEQLRKIATARNVTVDWLVGVPGAVKRPSEQQKRALGDELANHIRQEMVQRAVL